MYLAKITGATLESGLPLWFNEIHTGDCWWADLTHKRIPVIAREGTPFHAQLSSHFIYGQLYRALRHLPNASGRTEVLLRKHADVIRCNWRQGQLAHLLPPQPRLFRASLAREKNRDGLPQLTAPSRREDDDLLVHLDLIPSEGSCNLSGVHQSEIHWLAGNLKDTSNALFTLKKGMEVVVARVAPDHTVMHIHYVWNNGMLTASTATKQIMCLHVHTSASFLEDESLACYKALNTEVERLTGSYLHKPQPAATPA